MTTDQKQSNIQIERVFDTNVQNLYQAWTQLEHLCEWWHPMGETLTDVKCKLIEGGGVTYYIGDIGLEITGIYKEVVPNEKLIYSWIWNMNDEGSVDGYTLHVQFSPEGDTKSKLQVLQEGFSGAEHLPAHQQGWDEQLDQLSAYLSKHFNTN